MQGERDAEAGERWHYTDVEYGRWTDNCSRAKISTINMSNTKMATGLGLAGPTSPSSSRHRRKLRRDPCYPHIALATPAGFMRHYAQEVKHNRWLTLDGATEGDLALRSAVG